MDDYTSVQTLTYRSSHAKLAFPAGIGYKQVLEVTAMPRLEKVIKESELRSSRASAGMDLAPYIEILDRISQEEGVGGEVTLSPDESQRTEKRRLSVAAKQRGQKLTWRKSSQGRLRFVLSNEGSPPPDGRRRRKSS